MAKRLSEEQKKEITKRFSSGESIDKLSDEFNCTSTTIIRNLKKSLGEIKYKELIIMGKSSDQLLRKEYQKVPVSKDKPIKKDQIGNKNNDLNIVENIEQNFHQASPFIEITPLNYEIENSLQKDLASIPISEVQLPKIVYMIVDKNIELAIKDLKEYPEWNFLSHDELNRKTIEIYLDLKNAKRVCKKEQKIIKVPNTDVFRIVAPILISKGISRIVSPDQLIAL